MRAGRWIRRIGVLATLTGLVAGVGLGAAAAQREASGPVQPNVLAATGYSFAHPTIMPPGTNDWSCTPSAEHPHPVLLSNATLLNSYADWAGFAKRLAEAGYCVFSTNAGGSEGSPIQTVGPVAGTASKLAEFGDKVLAATGASKLDVVGHSQGGMNPRYWIKYLGGASKIGKLIGLAPSNHGTELFGLLSLVHRIPPTRDLVGLPFPSFNDQTRGSKFITELNAGGETVPGIDYTVIETRNDEVVTPYRSAFLKRAPNVHNVLLQDVCAQDQADHIGLSYDPIAQRLAMNALDPGHAKQPDCRFVPPVTS